MASLCVFPVTGWAIDLFDSVEWQLKRDRKDIQIYTGKVEGSSDRAVFSKMELEAERDSVVALLLDLDNCKRWARMCRDARIERRLTKTQAVVYSLSDIPFPVRDRDGYSTVTWSVNELTGVVTMDSDADIGASFPKRKGVVRVVKARVRWRVVPTQGGKLIVENYAHVDPNGSIPAWFSNIFIVDEPYKALRRMRSLLRSGAYAKAQVDFLPTKTN